MPITYHNVAPTTDGGRGTLFSGMKFWVSLRIPDRNVILRNIMDNGGEVKALDKLAQFLIVDPTKAPQPGSYSYEWITNSVREGIVLPKEEFACAGGTVAPAGRPGFAPARKAIRVPFTTEEDRFLTAWVIKHETKYASGGNKMFEMLAMQNPRHTYQSWRDRWVKKLSRLPRLAISQEELDAIDVKMPDTEARPAPVSLPQRTQPSPSAGRPTNTGGSQHATVRAKFTAEEDLVLLNKYFEVVNNRMLSKQKDLYTKLADLYPQHPAGAWSARLVKTIEVRVRDRLNTTLEEIGQENMPQLAAWLHSVKQDAASFWEMLEAEPAALTSPQARSPVATSPHVRTPAQPVIKKEVRSTPSRRAFSTPTKPSTTQKPAGTGPVVKEAPVIPSSPPAEDSEPPTPSPTQVATDVAPSSPQLPVMHVRHVIAQRGAVSEESKARADFYDDYYVYTEATRQKPVHFPSIAGHAFELWDLWREVMEQKMSPERDWELITENLGIDWNEHPDAPEQVRQFYETHLGLFEEATQNFDESDGEEAPGTAKDAAIPSSPPRMTHSKRPADNDRDDQSYSATPRKRHRHDRNVEIASTPDEKNGTSHLRYSDGHIPPSDADEDDEEELGSLEVQPNRRFAAEPETQDFQYETAKETQYYDAMDLDEDDELLDITPSQQLMLESDSVATPGPPTSPPRTAVVPATAPLTQGTPTPQRRVAKTPFLNDDSDREQTPLPMFKRPWAEKVAPAAKRRSLPKSFVVEQPAAQQSTSPIESPVPSRPPAPPHGPRPTTSSSSSSSRRPVTATSVATARTTTTPNTKPAPPQQQQQQSPSPPHRQEPRRPDPKEEKQKQEPDDVEKIISHHVSLGYPRDIVLKAMHATTWSSGIGTIVMDELKKGNPVPANARGVWTAKDDEYLALLMMDAEDRGGGEGGGESDKDKDSKKKKLLDRARRRLETKHTPAMIESRKKFLRQDEGSAWKAAR
ncbi:uncharacterized protein B0I36DRAFT_133338 [Microdochium trichocladiopsis]|uniref:DNA-binding protein RAP1 n=1 Tax=Microdochium trichocladiopsis TaxID=1682393 RepID=A0A9P8Y4P0_9PEZI|nr:uncharacterized protein B0I36DRAFT_133338 [Microdochium trichocladiopsis]KAH7029507.1 hypothetical protein B0I36DRAFT_133338 [Microdochium trichocladiopsis]